MQTDFLNPAAWNHVVALLSHSMMLSQTPDSCKWTLLIFQGDMNVPEMSLLFIKENLDVSVHIHLPKQAAKGEKCGALSDHKGGFPKRNAHLHASIQKDTPTHIVTIRYFPFSMSPPVTRTLWDFHQMWSTVHTHVWSVYAHSQKEKQHSFLNLTLPHTYSDSVRTHTHVVGHDRELVTVPTWPDRPFTSSLCVEPNVLEEGSVFVWMREWKGWIERKEREET